MKIFYSAYTCKENIGDLLITKYQIEEFAKYGKVYVDCNGMPNYFQDTILKSYNPNVISFEKVYGCHFRSKNILSVLHILNHEGFTHFCNSPGPREILQLPLKKLCFKLLGSIILRFALSKNIRRFSLGVDLNYKKEGILGALNCWYFNEYDVIGLRSKANLTSIHQYQRNTEYIPDMAFLYPSFNPESFSVKRKKVVISFRKVEDKLTLIKSLKTIVENLKKNNVNIDILYQVEDDLAFCSELYKELKNYGVHFRRTLLSFDELDIYAQYDMVISNRLHVLLMGAMNGAIPYALISRDIKEKKIDDIFSCVFSCKLVSYIDDVVTSDLLSIYLAQNNFKEMLINDIEIQRELCRSIFEKNHIFNKS